MPTINGKENKQSEQPNHTTATGKNQRFDRALMYHGNLLRVSYLLFTLNWHQTYIGTFNV
jgi:hypothetical protein